MIAELTKSKSQSGIVLAVTGGRTYKNEAFVFMVLDALHQSLSIALLVEGGALGADRLCRTWAEKRSVPFTTKEAEWEKHRRPFRKNPAGMIRNEEMLRQFNPNLLLAFEGGPGTEHCRKCASRLAIPVLDALKYAAQKRLTFG